jgi:hypothetical protein
MSILKWVSFEHVLYVKGRAEQWNSVKHLPELQNARYLTMHRLDGQIFWLWNEWQSSLGKWVSCDRVFVWELVDAELQRCVHEWKHG